MKKNIYAILILFLLLFVSCSTTYEVLPEPEKPEVQVLDVYASDASIFAGYFEPAGNTVDIKPEKEIVSAALSIDQLIAMEGAQTSRVGSSVLIQEEVKDTIKTQLENGDTVNVVLDDSTYGMLSPSGSTAGTTATGMTSGDLAKLATANSYTYINSLASYSNSIANYSYVEGKIYEIVTSPNAITDFRLKPGEVISGDPIVNDGGTNWNFTMGVSTENGQEIQHLFISPLIVGLDTSMIILTNQRTYYFRIASFSSSYMTAVRFTYPGESGYTTTANGTAMPGQSVSDFINSSSSSGYSMNMTEADYDYKISNYRGSPAWRPQTVFSDKVKTCIQLPVSVASSNELPTPYIVSGSQENLVNYHYFGNILMIDAVLTGNQYILLKNGQNQQVKILRNK